MFVNITGVVCALEEEDNTNPKHTDISGALALPQPANSRVL